MRLEDRLLNSSFSHIYIEKEAKNFPLTKKILEKLKGRIQVEIESYKEVFSKGNQDFMIQKKSPKLILAVKKENYLYKGAEVCQSFGNENFYYMSSVINCIFNCEYCYLQGVYSSGNIVIFVNIHDVFDEIERELEKRSMYLCISYDTDLLALDNITELTEEWYKLVERHKNLKIELRTKSSNISTLKRLKPLENFILAFTLSPREFAREYEKGTASFDSRLESMKTLIDLGWNVRVCFDPVIYVENFEKIYVDMVRETFEKIDSEKILDVSLGTFRISKDYLKRMRKNNRGSKILAYPFQCELGVYSYPKEMREKMINLVLDEICKYVERDKIYLG